MGAVDDRRPSSLTITTHIYTRSPTTYILQESVLGRGGYGVVYQLLQLASAASSAGAGDAIAVKARRCIFSITVHTAAIEPTDP